MRHLKFKITPQNEKKRLDVFLSETGEEITRSRAGKLIDQGWVAVNGASAKASYRLRAGDRIELKIPDPVSLELTPEVIPLQVVYEDDCMLIVDKPAGMVVHPAAGHARGTLVNALMSHCADLAGIGGVERPGIVHRLDKETSGLIVVAKNDTAHLSLTKQFKARKVKKVYLALVRGKFKSPTGTIDAPIGRHKIHRKKMAAGTERGRAAETRYEVIESGELFSLLRLYPKTGRTHQIRVHLASIGHPIIGDKLYGGKIRSQLPTMPRHALHAHKLELTHPVSGERLDFESPLPGDMAAFLSAAEGKKPEKTRGKEPNVAKERNRA